MLVNYPKVVEAPFVYNKIKPALFLAGSIEMGKAEAWQNKVIQKLEGLEIMVLNPRRVIWAQTIQPVAKNWQFKEQVDWELDGLEAADIIAFHFCPNTLSPISLLELGLYAKSGKIVVYCPNEFYRKGNVDVLSMKYKFPIYEDFDAFIKGIKLRMHEVMNRPKQ